MEKKIISIDISPNSDEEINENAGVMWEHNATSLIFNIDSEYVGDYRYYIEYRSLIGTKVRTEYLELNVADNTITYDIPVTMTSLRGVECFFNIVKIDEDGQTVQVIKPKKFYLEFDYSPGTDEALEKENDFSINALLEAIRTGAFQGGNSTGVVVDSQMSDTSSNPVQNKIVKKYIDSRVNIVTNSAMSDTSKDPVQNKVIKKYVDQKHNEQQSAITSLSNTVGGAINNFPTMINNGDEAVKTYVNSNFVAKEEGKGLSSNDFTDEYRTKLDGIDGYTPVKGIDYYTEADKEAFKDDLGIFADNIVSVSANLCDNEWEYGYFNDDGTEKDDLNPVTVSFRSSNYIEVQGGEFLCQNSNFGSYAKIVEYDENKQTIVGLSDFENEVNRWSENGITLNENTKYVRLAFYRTVTDLSTVQVNLFYIADINEMFADPGNVFVYVPRYITGDEYIDPQKIKTPLSGKKIVYDGDSICIGTYGGGGYAKIIADKFNQVDFVNDAVGGARLVTRTDSGHSVVDNLENLPTDGDLYCFEGGINDYWTEMPLGTFSKTDFTGILDKTTVCGALESIFSYALNTFVGKPVCFVITHKVQSTAYNENSNGDTFEDFHNAMVGICNKYSIPYYDAFNESGLNGWNTVQSNAYLTGNSNGTADGCHPNEEGYKKYYVPQLISLFEKIMPID